MHLIRKIIYFNFSPDQFNLWWHSGNSPLMFLSNWRFITKNRWPPHCLSFSYVKEGTKMSNTLISKININYSLQVVLVNRMVLNLTHARRNHNGSVIIQPGQHQQSYAVNSFLGNIGAPIRISSDSDWDGSTLRGDSIYLKRISEETFNMGMGGDIVSYIRE